MANNNQGTNWLAVGLVFLGCFVISVAIGQIVNDAAWAGIGVGLGIVMVGVVHAISTRP